MSNMINARACVKMINDINKYLLIAKLSGHRYHFIQGLFELTYKSKKNWKSAADFSDVIEHLHEIGIIRVQKYYERDAYVNALEHFDFNPVPDQYFDIQVPFIALEVFSIKSKLVLMERALDEKWNMISNGSNVVITVPRDDGVRGRVTHSRFKFSKGKSNQDCRVYDLQNCQPWNQLNEFHLLKEQDLA